MSVYSQLAEQLQYISPEFFKKRFFKKLNGLSAANVLSRQIEPELFWIKKFLKPDAVFVDIGANVGAYIYRLESHLIPKNIYAFEPNRMLYKRLRRIFPEINLFDTALSAEDSVAEFKVPVMNGKKVHTRGTLQKNHKEAGETSAEVQKVKVMRLDSWQAERNLPKIDFIKIDVEGHELETLRGAKDTIQKFRPVLMVEIEQRHHAAPVWDIVEEISQWGYAPHYLERTEFGLQKISREVLENQNSEHVKNYAQYINNIIFLPR